MDEVQSWDERHATLLLSKQLCKEKKAQKQVVGLLTILPTGSVST